MPATDIVLLPEQAPIKPIDFADYVSGAIQCLNPDFHCEGVMRKVFFSAGAMYNHCVDLNDKGKSVQLVNATATGSGKTVSMIEYSSRIAAKGFSCLLVVSEIDTASDHAKRINSKVGKEVAGVHHAITTNHPKHDLWFDIEELPRVTIITHSLFIKRSDSGKQIELLRQYKGKQRDLIVVDERIDLVKRVNFGTAEIHDATGILSRDDSLKHIVKGLSSLKECIHSFPADGSHEYKGDWKDWCISFGLALSELIGMLKDGHYNLTQQMRGRRNTNLDRDNVIKLLERIRYVITDRFTQIKEGKNIVCHREECLADKFGSVVVLDATSNVNPEYVFRARNNKNIIPIARIPSRNYSKVTLNVCDNKRAKQSKHSLFNLPNISGRLKNILVSYLEVVGSSISPDDKVLVATYKDLVHHFEAVNPYDNVKFVHWGSKDTRGSNEFKEYNKAFVIGWFRKPKSYYSQSLGAICSWGNYIPTNGSRLADAIRLCDMLIVDDMIQFFNRVRCRTPIDVDGNCLPVELFCFTGGSQKMKELIESSCKSEMPNIKIKEWSPTINQCVLRETVNEKRAVSFVKWLSGKIGLEQEVFLHELRDAFELKPNLVAKVIKTEVFNDLLEDEGIVFIPSRGGYKNPARFILPPCTL